MLPQTAKSGWIMMFFSAHSLRTRRSFVFQNGRFQSSRTFFNESSEGKTNKKKQQRLSSWATCRLVFGSKFRKHMKRKQKKTRFECKKNTFQNLVYHVVFSSNFIISEFTCDAFSEPHALLCSRQPDMFARACVCVCLCRGNCLLHFQLQLK